MLLHLSPRRVLRPGRAPRRGGLQVTASQRESERTGVVAAVQSILDK